ncbi:MAG: DUF1972 domain-containing protein [Lachnospiraceae bacterium]|nr:DUF1972 domain-containing protein [Lachnospiraceae bacterium]
MKHIFIIGCKGIPAQYGGFESFVENLTGRAVSGEIRYHVACMGDRQERFSYHHADCFRVAVPKIGPAKAVWYDIAAFRQCIRIMKEEGIREPVVYVLACRIGPFVGHLKRKLRRFGGKLYVNPDGHEFKRAKWNALIRRYWKFSEGGMVKHADLLICDSKNMERYIQTEYSKKKPATAYIAYGTDDHLPAADGKRLQEWYAEHGLRREGYYLVVGRFVPENNYETIIREFMRTDTDKRLVFITNVEHNRFYDHLREATHFAEDARIIFAGTVYDGELLAQIRANAYGYLHGHEVGGTNPSLLEALATTELNLLLDVGFNREVAEDSAIYWNKEPGSLAGLIREGDRMHKEQRMQLGERAKERMRRFYGWSSIVEQYERLFLSEGGAR